MLYFQQLDVYRCSIAFLALTTRLLTSLPRGYAPLADQLRRAAASIPLNIAESQGRVGDGEKAHALAIARGSAMECAAVMDLTKALGLVAEEEYREGINLLERVVAMLTKMCRTTT